MNQDEPNPPGYHPTPFTEKLLNQGNRKMAALVRDDELERIRRGIMPVDLRTVPPRQWSDFTAYDLTLPPAVAQYLDGREPAPLTPDEMEALCAQVAAYHGIDAPWYVDVSATMEHAGRPWAFVPELASQVTGFYLEHE